MHNDFTRLDLADASNNEMNNEHEVTRTHARTRQEAAIHDGLHHHAISSMLQCEWGRAPRYTIQIHVHTDATHQELGLRRREQRGLGELSVDPDPEARDLLRAVRVLAPYVVQLLAPELGAELWRLTSRPSHGFSTGGGRRCSRVAGSITRHSAKLRRQQ